jgi:hypothetical protein
MNRGCLLLGAHVQKTRPSVVWIVLEVLGKAQAEGPLVTVQSMPTTLPPEQGVAPERLRSTAGTIPLLLSN